MRITSKFVRHFPQVLPRNVLALVTLAGDSHLAETSFPSITLPASMAAVSLMSLPSPFRSRTQRAGRRRPGVVGRPSRSLRPVNPDHVGSAHDFMTCTDKRLPENASRLTSLLGLRGPRRGRPCVVRASLCPAGLSGCQRGSVGRVPVTMQVEHQWRAHSSISVFDTRSVAWHTAEMECYHP